MKRMISLMAILTAFIMSGCATKPQVITKVEYQEVLVPTPCIKFMPKKPKYDKTNPQSVKDLLSYFKLCEELLKGCAKDKDE